MPFVTLSAAASPGILRKQPRAVADEIPPTCGRTRLHTAAAAPARRRATA